jgi:hypothetical protein
MDIERTNVDGEPEAGTDDLDVPTPDADAVTGGVLIARDDDDDDPMPEHSCKG